MAPLAGPPLPLVRLMLSRTIWGLTTADERATLPIVTIPNQITLARILATPLFMFFLYAEGTIFKILALAIFALAAISDAVDGYLARALHQETRFG